MIPTPSRKNIVPRGLAFLLAGQSPRPANLSVPVVGGIRTPLAGSKLVKRRSKKRGRQ
jgi:hypothetical protein